VVDPLRRFTVSPFDPTDFGASLFMGNAPDVPYPEPHVADGRFGAGIGERRRIGQPLPRRERLKLLPVPFTEDSQNRGAALSPPRAGSSAFLSDTMIGHVAFLPNCKVA